MPCQARNRRLLRQTFRTAKRAVVVPMIGHHAVSHNSSGIADGPRSAPARTPHSPPSFETAATAPQLGSERDTPSLRALGEQSLAFAPCYVPPPQTAPIRVASPFSSLFFPWSIGSQGAGLLPAMVA